MPRKSRNKGWSSNKKLKNLKKYQQRQISEAFSQHDEPIIPDSIKIKKKNKKKGPRWTWKKGKKRPKKETTQEPFQAKKRKIQGSDEVLKVNHRTEKKSNQDAECAKQVNNFNMYEQSACEDLYQDDDKLFNGETVIMEESKNSLNSHEHVGTFGGEGKHSGFSIKTEKDTECVEQDNSHINEQSACDDLYQNDDKLFIGDTVIMEESKYSMNFHEQVESFGWEGKNSRFSVKKEKDAECTEQANNLHINEQSACEDLNQYDDKLFIGETVIMQESKNILNYHELPGTCVGEENNCGFSIKKEDAECGQQDNNLHTEQSTGEDLYPDDDKLFIGETVIMEDSKNFMNSNEREVRIAQLIDYAEVLDVEELDDVILFLTKVIKDKNELNNEVKIKA